CDSSFFAVDLAHGTGRIHRVADPDRCFEANAGAQEDRARTGKLGSQNRGKIAQGQHAMRDAAPEDGRLGVVLVEMQRIKIAGNRAELLDIALGDGAGIGRRLSDRQILDVMTHQSRHGHSFGASVFSYRAWLKRASLTIRAPPWRLWPPHRSWRESR